MPTTTPAPAPQPSRRSSPRRRRTTARILHLAAAGVLGVFIYAPAAVTGPLQTWMQLLVVPALSTTGLFLWKQAQLRRAAQALSRQARRLISHAH